MSERSKNGNRGARSRTLRQPFSCYSSAIFRTPWNDFDELRTRNRRDGSEPLHGCSSCCMSATGSACQQRAVHGIRDYCIHAVSLACMHGSLHAYCRACMQAVAIARLQFAMRAFTRACTYTVAVASVQPALRAYSADYIDTV